MLDMANDRLDYLELLRPPKDHKLVYAVGTTYSLDLGALLGACMSLAGIDTEVDPRRANKVALFAALETVQDRISFYCEKGRIKNDAGFGRLSILLERIINQVVVSPADRASDAIASFHPKVWIVDYIDIGTKEHLYRLIVMSRNLTFDGSWDVAACLEGHDTDSAVPESEPIANFLEYLRTRRGVDSDKNSKARMLKLIRRIEQVRFEVDSGYFDGFEFMPLGPSYTKLLNPSMISLMTDGFSRVMVVSPFLSNTGLLEAFLKNRGQTATRDGEYYLVSRQQSLDELSSEIRDQFHCYAPQTWLADVDLEQNEFDIGSEASETSSGEVVAEPDDCNTADAADKGESLASRFSNLHAKMYFTENWGGRNLYLGSLNASRNGTRNNVEALIRFHVKPYKLTFNEFRDALVGGKDSPFAQYQASIQSSPDVNKVEIEFDKRFHVVAKTLTFERADVTHAEPEGYCLCVKLGFDSQKLNASDRYTIAPLLAASRKYNLSSDSALLWDRIEVAQLSQFFVLTAKSAEGAFRSCIVKCPNDVFNDSAIDHASRVQDLFDHILTEWDDALSTYVDIAFGIDSSFGDNRQISQGKLAGMSSSMHVGAGLYEQLMNSLVDYDSALDRLEYARYMIDLIPPSHKEKRIADLRSLLDTFEGAVKRMGRRNG